MLTGALFGFADRHAHWLNVRQRTIAENVTHSNTPAYVSKTVSDFGLGSNRFQVSPTQSDNNHIMPRNNATARDPFIRILEDPSGNPVRLEDEMIAALDVRRSYELNTSIIKAFNRMILSAAKS